MARVAAQLNTTIEVVALGIGRLVLPPDTLARAAAVMQDLGTHATRAGNGPPPALTSPRYGRSAFATAAGTASVQKMTARPQWQRPQSPRSSARGWPVSGYTCWASKS